MPATDERYPALVERALRLIEERGEPVAGEELCRELFGAPGRPWLTLLSQVLGGDARLVSLGDGRWRTAAVVERSADRKASARSAPPEPGAAAAGAGEAGIAAGSGAPVGLVVLGTGPKPWRHPIVALGAARQRADGGLERWQTLVRPPAEDGRTVRVPAYLTAYGVVAAELDEAPPLDRAIDELLDFVGAAPLAGLDVALAVARLQFALRQLGRRPLDNPTIELSIPGEEKPDLARLAGAAGLPVPIRPTPATLAALAAQLAGRAPAGQSAGGALGATAWRRLLDARLLARVPDRPGVYRFLAADGRLLYVGKATSLRGRLASYLTGSFPLTRRMPGLVEATDRLEWDELAGELVARLREAELIAAERPAYNVQRRAGLALVRARLRLDGTPDPSGRRVPRLELELDAREGVVTATAAARAALRRARAGWWPPRPSAGARPAPPAVLHRFELLAAAVADELLGATVAPGLRAADLRGLVVVAPSRPRRATATAGPDDGPDGWTRERHDATWPPRELAEQLAPIDEAWPEPIEPGVPAEGCALLVDTGGLRAEVELDELPGDEAELRAAAVAALAGQPSSQPAPDVVGRAVLAPLLAALIRREAGLRAWPAGAAELA